jgi:hypothetical protein
LQNKKSYYERKEQKMAKQLNQVNVNHAFTADTGKAKAQL